MSTEADRFKAARNHRDRLKANLAEFERLVVIGPVIAFDSTLSTYRRMAWFRPAPPQTAFVASTGIIHEYYRAA